MYQIFLKYEVPVKGYVLRQTPAMVQAINDKLEKLKKADFIELFISMYFAPINCFKKSDNILWLTIDLE